LLWIFVCIKYIGTRRQVYKESRTHMNLGNGTQKNMSPNEHENMRCVGANITNIWTQGHTDSKRLRHIETRAQK
jgi:hypothetical protein